MTTSDDLKKMISARENIQVDFKIDATQEVLRGFSTDVASFANTQGGTIIFGVTDDGNPIGCNFTKTQRDRISQEASKCRPMIRIDLEEVVFDSKKFVLVKIPKSLGVHSDYQQKFPARNGNMTDYLDSSAVLMLLQERNIIRGETPQASPQRYARLSPSPEEAANLAKLIGSSDRTARLEFLKDLVNTAYSYSYLENDLLAGQIAEILGGNDVEELGLVLDFLRNIANIGSETEKTVFETWFPRIEDLAKSASSPDLARKSFEVLKFARSNSTVTVLSHWITKRDDDFFEKLQLENMLSEIAYFGVKPQVRQMLYKILQESEEPTLRKRSMALLEILRKSFG